MAEEKIMTLHPEGKKGVNISKAKYDIVKQAIIDALGEQVLTHTELTDSAKGLLTNFDGAHGWYIETVKLDLEARDIVIRDRDRKPQTYKLK